ncbi:amidohydrolase family protein [Phytoactinopolyspora limicola]|uniref:amidohydrolase family protein n=1 Tax=Phytoactinopolyspora limicola TaxID=2715536 RepID=UPI00140DD281|nr:amidohydrolase family protein [Phytoactinopolyspora limicola]
MAQVRAVNDAHVHVWSDPPNHPDLLVAPSASGKASDLLDAMDSAGVGRAAVITPGAMGWDNTASLRAAGNHPERLIAVGRVDISDEQAARRLEKEIASGLRGIRFNIGGRRDAELLFERAARQVWEVVARAGVSVALHVAPGQLSTVPRLAAVYPGTTFLLDHLGLPDVAAGVSSPEFQSVLAVAACDNVWVKTPNAAFFSELGPPFDDLSAFISAGIEAFGADRVLWGSDWPLCATSFRYSDSLEPTMTIVGQGSRDEQHAVMGGNFERLYVHG